MPLTEPPPLSFPDGLWQHSRRTELARGETLFVTGTPVHTVYLVERGELRAVRTLADGSEAVMMRAGPGELFAIASLFMPTYPCDAVAITATVVRALPRSDFEAALTAHPDFAAALVKTLAMGIKKQCGRVERLRLKRARDRVLHFLACESRDGSIELHMPLLAWANELGLEPETLYRVLAELEREGRITRNRRHIRLLVPARTGDARHGV